MNLKRPVQFGHVVYVPVAVTANFPELQTLSREIESEEIAGIACLIHSQKNAGGAGTRLEGDLPLKQIGLRHLLAEGCTVPVWRFGPVSIVALSPARFE